MVIKVVDTDPLMGAMMASILGGQVISDGSELGPDDQLAIALDQMETHEDGLRAGWLEGFQRYADIVLLSGVAHPVVFYGWPHRIGVSALGLSDAAVELKRLLGNDTFWKLTADIQAMAAQKSRIFQMSRSDQDDLMHWATWLRDNRLCNKVKRIRDHVTKHDGEKLRKDPFYLSALNWLREAREGKANVGQVLQSDRLIGWQGKLRSQLETDFGELEGLGVDIGLQRDNFIAKLDEALSRCSETAGGLCNYPPSYCSASDTTLRAAIDAAEAAIHEVEGILLRYAEACNTYIDRISGGKL